MKNKKGVLINLFAAILIITIILLVMWFTLKAASRQAYEITKCKSIKGCEKYKCFSEVATFTFSSINYKLDYQNCLLEKK